MQLPPQLDAKFKELVGRYPVKRSALIPMMIYAQDQFGFLGDEILEEIAKRLDLNMVQVTETLAYYSMLRRKPAGQKSHSGLHEYFLHAARRQRAVRTRSKAPGNWQ